jgi:hypothetical protein
MKRRRKDDHGLDAIAAHLREHGPLLCKRSFQQLVDLDAAFPGITVVQFIRAGVIVLLTEAET